MRKSESERQSAMSAAAYFSRLLQEYAQQSKVNVTKIVKQARDGLIL